VDVFPEQNAILRHDVRVLQSYGNLHPESFTGLRIDGSRIRMAFADDLEQHRTAISTTLRNPDALTLEEALYSREELQSIRAEIAGAWRDDPRQPLMGDGVGYSTASVHLRPPFARLAQELHRQYGEALEITIGFKRFPPQAALMLTNYAAAPQETLSTPHIGFHIELNENVVAAGDDVRGQVWLTNKGVDPIKIDSGSAAAGGIRRPDSDQMSGWFSGPLAGVGVTFRLAPKERGAIALVVGTASCEPTDLYVPSPGLYEVVARIRARVSSSDGAEQEGEMLAHSATLTLR
jgi:hypothetical protein